MAIGMEQEHDQERMRSGEHLRGEAPTDGARRRPTGMLLRELAGEGTALLRAEVTLAKTEIGESLQHVQRGVVSAATGGAILHAGVLALLASAILALSLVWPDWLAALVVGAIAAVVGLILVGNAKREMKAESLKPNKFMDSIREDRDFAREEMDRAGERLQ